MDFDKALEFAVVSSWAELVTPNEQTSIHVEYRNQRGSAIDSLQVWAVRERGHGTLICDYSALPSGSSQAQRIQFSNSYVSSALVEGLDFIMQNQPRFARSAGDNVNGLVQVGVHSKQEQATVTTWWRAVMSELSKEACLPKKQSN
jgi:hypothetical protein